VSFAGQLGTLLEPAIKPLGFNWEIGFAIVASFPAREVFVTGLSTVYNVSDDEDTHSGIISHLRAKSADGTFSTLTALSLMIFYVFACQCMSTLAVCRRETGSWAWTGGMFIYMTLLAYLASLTVYQIGIRL
jgi:ferrous iron transport protein B